MPSSADCKERHMCASVYGSVCVFERLGPGDGQILIDIAAAILESFE